MTVVESSDSNDCDGGSHSDSKRDDENTSDAIASCAAAGPTCI